MPSLDVGRLVFLDETGSNAAMGRRIGWAPRGERLSLPRPAYATNVSLIGAMAHDGVRAAMAVKGPVDGDVFIAYLENFLCPKLVPGDILVMDNLRVHKLDRVKELVEATGARVLFQPPYSPDLNPIELLWAWLKRHLRGRAPRSAEAVVACVGDLLRKLPDRLCSNWIRHCGYHHQLR